MPHPVSTPDVGGQLARLVARVRSLLQGQRVVLGIAGAPGAGKSTLADQLVAALGDRAVLVPMDGFHLQDDELHRRGLLDRKGAPETFDVGGYAALLRRVRLETENVVYAPAFDRDREISLAGAIPVHPWHDLVVTEGNYLLLDAPGWSSLLPLLDESWFVQADEEVRRTRLTQRHIAHGRPAEEARRWAEVSDQANADLVARTRMAADLVVDLD